MKKISKVCIALALMTAMLCSTALAGGMVDLTQDPSWYPYEPEFAPLYVVNCKEWISVWNDSAGTERKGYLPLGSKIYQWAPYNEDFLYFDLVGDGGFVSWDYVSYEKGGKSVGAKGSSGVDSEAKNANDRPLYVVNCNEWISVWAEPRSGSLRHAKLPKGMRLDKWQPYNDDFVIFDTGIAVGYVSWDYLSFEAP